MKPFHSDLFFSTLILSNTLLWITPVEGQMTNTPPTYRNPAATVENRVNDLLARMTVEEKIAQLQCTMKKIEWGKNLTEKGLGGVGPILRSLTASEAVEKGNAIQKLAVEKTRLGIPVLFHDEALHGLLANKATSFPQATGLAATWDTDLMSRVATAIGKETRSRGIRQVLSPVVNIARDVRWGRVEETYGEDPFLSSRMGAAFCSAIEEQGVITTPKHFVANVGDGGRDSNPIYFSERLLREVYFPPFKACIQEGNARSVMAAYNAINDVPCSADPWLLTDVLRKEWGFKGFVVSDYGSVWGIKTKHFVAATDKEAARKAVEAGLDMELPDIDFYGTPLLEGVKDGTVSAVAIDNAVANVLRAKFQLGLFENPYADSEAAPGINDSREHRQLAREAAQKAIVLLKNDGPVLPLKSDLKSIAVIGPMADSAYLGDYSGWGMEVVSVLEGIKRKAPRGTAVTYAKGCTIGFKSLLPIPSENLIPPGAKPGEHGLKGEYFNNMDLSGTPTLVRIDKQVSFEWAMGSPDLSIPVNHFSVRWTGKIVPDVSGTYTLGAGTDDGVRLYLDGKLLIDSWFDRGATLDEVTVKLEAGRQYNIKIEYYENEGWCYASLGWELKTGTNPELRTAVEVARKSDVAIIVVGTTEGEGYDRASLDLPGQQEHLITSVAETGTPTVVVVLAGSAVTMKNWIDNAAAVVDAWYPGEEGGNAVADVLFGDYNPGGKLPLTFPQFVGQVPLYYNTAPTGRGYDYSDMSGRALFPFGHGLSYTKFTYSNLRVTPREIPAGGKAEISVDVHNDGGRRGDEVVQLYLHDPVASVTRPIKELRGFKRITLDPNETKTVHFEIGKEELSFLDQKMKSVIEPGTIDVMVGSSSDDIRVKSSFEILAE